MLPGTWATFLKKSTGPTTSEIRSPVDENGAGAVSGNFPGTLRVTHHQVLFLEKLHLL